MRARTFGVAVAAVAVAYAVLTVPALVGLTVMLVALVAIWRSARRMGVRR